MGTSSSRQTLALPDYFKTFTRSDASGTLQFNLTAVAPPSNDNFASASVAATLPFSNSVDTTAATLEANEPSLCTPPPSEKTVWYAFTPASSVTVSASASSFFAPAAVALYTGNSVANLTQVACGFAQTVTTRLTAGTTYYFQVGSVGQSGGPILFNLAIAPPPQVALIFFPSDPSTFDNVQFISQTFDPGGAAFTSIWTFGDGTTSTEQFPLHRYGADGQYTVRLAITTTDGRTASATQVVRVATHDESITSFDAPQAVKVGKTPEITVGISNGRYPDRVQVQLFKSNTSGGFDLVGTLIQTVPVRAGKRVTPFTFNNTFTEQDAAVGKVTFMATATLLDARDALPFDNQAIALPTVVRR